MAADKRDYTCPICLCIFIEPVTLPCKHTLCMPCYKQTVEKANLCCPICRRRISVWARLATKTSSLVDVAKWEAVKKMFPDLVQNRLDGKEELNQDDDDDDDDADNIETQLRRLKELSRPGEIRQEFEAALQQFQHRREEEVKLEEEASSALIKAIQEEEQRELEELERLREELNKMDRETAEKLQAEALDTEWSILTEQENKNPLSIIASASSEKDSKTGQHSTSSTTASASDEKGSKTGQLSTSSTKASASNEKSSITGQHSIVSTTISPSNGKNSKTGKHSTTARAKKGIKKPAKGPSNLSLTLTTFFSPVHQNAGLPSSPDVNNIHSKRCETYKSETKSHNNGYCMYNNDLPNFSSSDVIPAQESHENCFCRDADKSQGCIDRMPQTLIPATSSPEKGKDALMFSLKLDKKSSEYDHAGQSVCGMSDAIEEVSPISFQTAEVEKTSQSGDSYPKYETLSDNAVPYIYPSTSSRISVDYWPIVSGGEHSFIKTVNDCLRNNELTGPQCEQNPILSTHTRGNKDLGNCQQDLGNSQVCGNRGEISASGDSGSGASVQEIFGGLDEASTESKTCRSPDYHGEPQEKVVASLGVNPLLGSNSLGSRPADLMSKTSDLDSRQVVLDKRMAGLMSTAVGSDSQMVGLDSKAAGLINHAVVLDSQTASLTSLMVDSDSHQNSQPENNRSATEQVDNDIMQTATDDHNMNCVISTKSKHTVVESVDDMRRLSVDNARKDDFKLKYFEPGANDCERKPIRKMMSQIASFSDNEEMRQAKQDRGMNSLMAGNGDYTEKLSTTAGAQQAKPTTQNIKNEPSVMVKTKNPQCMSIERWCVPDCSKTGSENNLKILSGKNLGTNNSRPNSKEGKKLQDRSLKRKRSPSSNNENEVDLKCEKPQAHSQKRKLLRQTKLQNGMFPVSKTEVGHEGDQLLGSKDKSGLSLEESDHQYALMLQEIYLKQDMRGIRVDRFKGSKDEYSLRKKLQRK